MTDKADALIHVVTEDCADDEVHAHEINCREGQSIFEATVFAMEAVGLLYATKGIKSIHIYLDE